MLAISAAARRDPQPKMSPRTRSVATPSVTGTRFSDEMKVSA